MRVTTLEMKPTTAVGKLKEEEACAGIEVVIFESLSGLRVKKCVRNRGFSRIDL